MNVYWLIPVISVVILAICEGAIISSNKRDIIWRNFLLFNTCILLFSIVDIFLWILPLDAPLVIPIMKLQSPLWIFLGFLFLNFIYAVINRKSDLVHKLLFGTAMVSSFIALFTNLIVENAEHVYWGNYAVMGNAAMLIIFITAVIPILFALTLLLKAYIVSHDSRLKKSYQYIMAGVSCLFFISIITDVILPIYFNIHFISLMTLSAAIMALFFLVSIRKLKFFDFTITDLSEKIFNEINEGVVISTINGDIVYCNLFFSAHFETNETQRKQVLNEILKRNEPHFKITTEADKANLEMHFDISKSRIDHNKILYNLYIIRDVTLLNKTNVDLENLNKELNFSLYRMGHDFKGPVLTLKQLATMMLEEPENTNILLPKMVSVVNSLIEITQDVQKLLTLKESSVTISTVPVFNLIHEIWEGLQSFRQNEPHTISIEIDKTAVIRTDKSLLTTIIYNLLSNAIKFNDIIHKGKNDVTIMFKKDNNHNIFSIKDNGIGMNEKIMNNLFKMFFRGTSNVSGTGLGLYLLKNAVEKLNGQISVNSIEKESSEFIIQLPIV